MYASVRRIDSRSSIKRHRVGVCTCGDHVCASKTSNMGQLLPREASGSFRLGLLDDGALEVKLMLRVVYLKLLLLCLLLLCMLLLSNSIMGD